MSLRTRLAALTSVAVALAIVAASVAAWFLIRSSLLDDVDQKLLERVPNADMIAAATLETDRSVGSPGRHRNRRRRPDRTMPGSCCSPSRSGSRWSWPTGRWHGACPRVTSS